MGILRDMKAECRKEIELYDLMTRVYSFLLRRKVAEAEGRSIRASPNELEAFEKTIRALKERPALLGPADVGRETSEWAASCISEAIARTVANKQAYAKTAAAQNKQLAARMALGEVGESDEPCELPPLRAAPSAAATAPVALATSTASEPSSPTSRTLGDVDDETTGLAMLLAAAAPASEGVAAEHVAATAAGPERATASTSANASAAGGGAEAAPVSRKRPRRGDTPPAECAEEKR